ncbi:MAG: NAD(P)/FAD-dependent oxidoreductase [Chitinophagaceae bacterium]
MVFEVSLKFSPAELSQEDQIRQHLGRHLGVDAAEISGYIFLKKSLDARSKNIFYSCSLKVFVGEAFKEDSSWGPFYQHVHQAKKRVIIVGAGPAGLFAGLRLMELGIQPILLERGKEVRLRRRDIALLNKEGILNPESNYCFGEGGAGTYSDGKLYTRSKKRGDVARILKIFVHFGADPQILFEAHPHIGTNKLPQIITSIRERIITGGGAVHFGQKVIDFLVEDRQIKGVLTATGEVFQASQVILCTGHSARDIFELLDRRKILLESKSFALGVRIEHPQELINQIQYHRGSHSADLPPASYNLVKQVEGRGVFSFCMCPGGIIAPASTSPGELVVNGWSPSRRNNPFANSGIVVSVDQQDFITFEKRGTLAGMYFQQAVEQKAFQQGGGKFVAPAQRMTDFVNKKISTSLPSCSYLPGIVSRNLQEVLPSRIYEALSVAFREFGKKMNGFFSEEGVILATESRTSSPVRIPRDPMTLEHPQIKGLFPCGEGAGYAGGIVSAAMDGERVAERMGF